MGSDTNQLNKGVIMVEMSYQDLLVIVMVISFVCILFRKEMF